MAALLEERAHGAVDLRAVDAGAEHLARQLERLHALLVPRRRSSGRASPTVNVRVMSEKHAAVDVSREQVADDVIVVRDPPRALVVTVGGLRAVGGDQVVAGAPVRREARDAALAQQLARERLAVDDAPSVAGLGAREERRDRGHRRLGRARGARMPSSFAARLAAAAVVEEPLVDRQLDAGGAELVGMAERERRRHDRVAGGRGHVQPGR